MIREILVGPSEGLVVPDTAGSDQGRGGVHCPT